MRDVAGKFLADRGTHLAAMIAYFALLSFVPLLFIAVSLLGLVGQQHESSFLVEQLREAFPQSSVDDLVGAVEGIRRHAGELTLIGIVGLAWGSLGFFSALESAFNIVYGVRNRGFARQKALMVLLIGAALAVLFVGLLAGSVGVDLVLRAGVGSWLAYAAGIAVSSGLVLAFVWGAYRLITNVRLGWRETLPGALVATALLEASFQLVPVFVAAAGQLASLRAFGGLLAMLVWLYLMANVIVLGAEVNVVYGRRPYTVSLRALAARARWLLTAFQSSPSSPTVSDSPSGTNTGS
jgi:YihY family inner membrane protein